MCFSINMIIRIFLCRYYLYLRGHERWFWYCCSSKRVASRIYVTHVQIAFCIKPMRVVVTPLISRNPAKEVVEFLSGMPSEELSSCLYFCDIQGNTFESGRGLGGVFLNQTLGRWTVSMLFPSSPTSPNDNNDLVTYSYRGRWNSGGNGGQIHEKRSPSGGQISARGRRAIFTVQTDVKMIRLSGWAW